MTDQSSGPTGAPISLRILIVEDETFVGLAIKNYLLKLGHQPIGHADTSAAAMDLFRREKPDMVLVDIKLDHEDGIVLAEKLRAERPCPVVIVTAYADPELIARAAKAGVFGYMIKPISPEALHAQIQIATGRFGDLAATLEQRDKLAKDLETRKLVERAKGVLMKHLNLPEDEAHRRLQQESQKRRIGLADIARRIIESEELLRG